MNTFDDLTDQTFHSVIGRNVVDERGEHIGTLDALWTDEDTGKVEFIGVKTGWIFGKTHVVPVRGVEIHDDQDHVRVPYEAHFVKDAPSYPADQELSDAQEQEIYQYCGVSRAGGLSGTTTTTETAGAPLVGRRTDERLTEDVVAPAGAASTTAGTRADLTGADIRGVSDRGESVENPVVERGPAGAREPIGETTVSGARAEALPGDRSVTGERRDVIETPLGRDVETERRRDVTAGEQVEIPTEEERLRVGTREVGAGRVRLRKVVRTEQANVPVELRREDVVVERVPADQVRASEHTHLPEGQDVELELRREEPVVEKERVVTGAVRARKTEEVQRQTVSDQIRKEDVEVDRTGTESTATTGTEAEREREREREVRGDRPEI